jgi:phosphatidylglycerol:prolipoprotein diacylglycerol transferase
MFPWELLAYYFLISLDCIILLFWLVRRSNLKKIESDLAFDLSLVLMFSALIGARLFHVIYDEPALYREDLNRIFKVWFGGFVFYGGMLAAIISGIIWVNLRKQDLFFWLDFFAPMGAFAYSFGRLSCVLAGCCYGKEAHNLPWAITNKALQDGVLRHPTQWYAVIWELLVLVILLFIEKKQFLKKGNLFFIWIILHGSGRIIMERFRVDPRGELIANQSISTWISAGLIFIGVFFLGARKFKSWGP